LHRAGEMAREGLDRRGPAAPLEPSDLLRDEALELGRKSVGSFLRIEVILEEFLQRLEEAVVGIVRDEGRERVGGGGHVDAIGPTLLAIVEVEPNQVAVDPAVEVGRELLGRQVSHAPPPGTRSCAVRRDRASASSDRAAAGATCSTVSIL